MNNNTLIEANIQENQKGSKEMSGFRKDKEIEDDLSSSGSDIGSGKKDKNKITKNEGNTTNSTDWKNEQGLKDYNENENNENEDKSNVIHGDRISQQASISSLSLQSPHLIKSSPANPFTTRKDASSHTARSDIKSVSTQSEHGLDDSMEWGEFQLKNLETTGANKPDLAINSGATWVNGTAPNSSAATAIKNDIKSDILSDSDGKVNSPTLISFRKPRKSLTEDNFQNILEQANQADTFNPKLYVDEKFKDTDYRYATMKRNVDYHQLFNSIDLTDRLLDDFACALSREILLQGRIYVSAKYVCFNSNLLGWVTNLIIPQEEILLIEKKTTAGLFPNGIVIETKSAKHNFASFLLRDQTYDFMQTVWHRNEPLLNDLRNSIAQNGTKQSNSELKDENTQDTSEKLESYIMSVDDHANSLEGDEETNSHRSSEESASTESSPMNGARNIKKLKVVRFKPGSKYVNMGPESHAPTTITNVDPKKGNRVVLCDETIDAPLGVVFDILFGRENYDFKVNYYKNLDISELSPYGKFHPDEKNPAELQRTMTYRKQLGFSIGPKSTRCEAKETIKKLDFNDYVEVVASTATPDVPLGTSFIVRNIHYFSWGPNNKTNLRIEFYVDWIGSSWIKSIIDKQALNGQKEAVKILLEHLRKEISENTYLCDLAVSEIDLEENRETEKVEEIESVPTSTFKNNLFSSFSFQGINVLVLVAVFLLCVFMFLYYLVGKLKAILYNEKMLNVRLLLLLQQTSHRRKSVLNLVQGDNEEFWKWVGYKLGKKFNSFEKLDFLSSLLDDIEVESCQL